MSVNLQTSRVFEGLVDTCLAGHFPASQLSEVITGLLLFLHLLLSSESDSSSVFFFFGIVDFSLHFDFKG